MKTRSIEQKVEVSFEYPVCFTEKLFALENPLFHKTIMRAGKTRRHKLLFVIDEGFAQFHPCLEQQILDYTKHYSSELELVSPPIFVLGGEETKNRPENWEKIYQAIDQYKICRHSFIVAIGGGAVLDMVGFACAIPHRGIRLIRVPTTVLSQNDSGVGVKNAVNGFAKKNFFGTFAPPFAVLNDSEFLTTLSARDWLSGVSEAVKVALLKDKDFFRYLQREVDAVTHRDLDVMEEIVFRCAALHLDHIRNGGDPFETNHARPLDFGHWSAHKLETLSQYKIRHGEAVACGIALDTYYSYLKGILSEEDCLEVLHLLHNLGFPLYYSQLESPEIFLGLREFQEHLGGILSITLLRGIGEALQVHEMDEEKIKESILFLRSWEQSLPKEVAQKDEVCN